MEDLDQNCQTCFRPIAAEGARPQSQWTTFCRCDRPYSSGSQFSIDLCANCKMRVASDAAARVNCPGLCSCDKASPKKVPTYMKPNESDPITIELAAAGTAPESFPLDRYLPIGILGNGARASAVLARDKQRGNKVVIKCFKRIAPALRSTFESEARKNKELNHTNIAKTIDFGYRNDKAPYLVTEYKDGFNLEQCLSLYGTPSQDVAIKILLSICEASLYAQKQGLLHRDIRPGNIIFLDDMNSEPSISVVDFALPKVKKSEELTEARDAQYISADEARNLEYDERSEVYSIGCIGYALLTGRPPFVDGSALDIKNSHALKLPPRMSDLKFDNTRSKELEEIIERCMEKDPRVRWESVSQLQERLAVFPRRQQMQIARVLNARKQKKMLLIAAAVLVVAVLGAGGYFILGPH